MAQVMYLRPIHTSSSSFSSRATIRRRGMLQRSSESLWSSFLADESTMQRLHQSRPHNSTGTSPKDESPKESFKSAYSRQCASASCQPPEPSAHQDTASQPSPLCDSLESHDLNTEQPADLQDANITAEVEPAVPDGEQPKPFRRWLSTLRRRKQMPPLPTTPSRFREALDDFDTAGPASCLPNRRSHKKSDSWASSSGIIATMKSATVTIASASIAPLSRRVSKRRQRHPHSSIVSGSDARPSFDSQPYVLDQAARQRSRKRREKIEELIRSEESYVADIKALCNAYFTLLGHQQNFASFARTTAQNTLSELLHLHDDLLGQLQRVVPFAEFDQATAKATRFTRPHARWHSVDGVTEHIQHRSVDLGAVRQGRRSLSIGKIAEHEPTVLHCSPQVIGAVSAVFSGYIPRFAVYSAFGAKFEMIKQDVLQTQGLVASWPDFDRAIEALSIAINPIKSREANKSKALTTKDLLIKPIQRLPRYELLFTELSRLTPVCDDPTAHALVEDVREQFARVCRSMNNAKDNPGHMRSLKTTWLLGERLTFSNQVPKAVFLHLLGEVLLCGCLHVTYRSRGDLIKGSYMICILFSTTLVLAKVVQDDPPRYSVLASLSLGTTVIEETDNACSAAEAKTWRADLGQGITSQARAIGDHTRNVVSFQSPLTAEMKSIGPAFGKPGSFVRRMSVHRSATVGPNTDLNQVIIKNTQAVKETMAPSGTLQLPRSQSTATPSHVQTLAPRRVDRIRLEALLSDVWSSALPYPGMTVRRTDQLKGSADQIMRKLSIASLASSFHSTKRNGSHTSIARMHREVEGSKSANRPGAPATENKKPARLPLSELLPADFELQNPPVQNKRRKAFQALTMTMERPFSPLLGESSVRRAQSVREQLNSTPDPGSMASVQESGKDVASRPGTTTADDGLMMGCSRGKQAVLEATGSPIDAQIVERLTPCLDEGVHKKGRGMSRLRRLFG